MKIICDQRRRKNRAPRLPKGGDGSGSIEWVSIRRNLLIYKMLLKGIAFQQHFFYDFIYMVAINIGKKMNI